MLNTLSLTLCFTFWVVKFVVILAYYGVRYKKWFCKLMDYDSLWPVRYLNLLCETSNCRVASKG